MANTVIFSDNSSETKSFEFITCTQAFCVG